MVLAACDASDMMTRSDGADDGKPDDGTSSDGENVPVEPTLVAIGAGGELAALALETPWSQRETAALGVPIESVRLHDGKLFVVTANALHILAIDLSVV